jgi:hypothetical protein
METGERIAYARGYRDHMDEIWQMVGHVCMAAIQAPHGSSDTLNSLYKQYLRMAYPHDQLEDEKTPSQKLAALLAEEGKQFNPPI